MPPYLTQQQIECPICYVYFETIKMTAALLLSCINFALMEKYNVCHNFLKIVK